MSTPRSPVVRTKLYRAAVPVLLLLLAIITLALMAAVALLLFGFISSPVK